MATGFRTAATVFCFAGLVAAANGAEQLKVDTKGVTARILYEAPINGGHLAELKGKYKMRITEISIAAGGHVGDHNHVGPGIRQMTVGEMEYIMPQMAHTYGRRLLFEPELSPRNQQVRCGNTICCSQFDGRMAGASLILPRDKYAPNGSVGINNVVGPAAQQALGAREQGSCRNSGKHGQPTTGVKRH